MGTALIYPPNMTFWRAMRCGLITPARSPAYLAFVASLPCCVTGARPVTVHHLVGHGIRGAGAKTDDYLTIPLAPELHLPNYPGGLHAIGHHAWEEKHGSQLEYAAMTMIEAIHRGVLVVRK